MKSLEIELAEETSDQVSKFEKLDCLSNYSSEVIERVKSFIAFQSTKPDSNLPWKSFKSVDDFILYHSSREDWANLNSKQLRQVPEGEQFFAALKYFKKKNPEKANTNNSPFQRKFPRFNFKTLEEWRTYVNAHPEFSNKSYSEIKKLKEGSWFYSCLNRWAHKESNGNRIKKHNLICKILKKQPSIPKSVFEWKNYGLEDWKNLFENKDGWEDKSVYDLRENKNFWNAYKAFGRWVRKRSDGDIEVQRRLVTEVRPPLVSYWDMMDDLDDWRKYFLNNPDWRGLGSTEMMTEKDSRTFYTAFTRWLKHSCESKSEYKQIFYSFFPENLKGRKVCSYDFKGSTSYFDSLGERAIGILLFNYGLVDKYEEDVNLHVNVRQNSRTTIDFLVDNTLLEYHPLQMNEKRQGLTLNDIKKKKKGTPKSKYAKSRFYIFDKIHDLYKILKKEWPEKFNKLSHGEFCSNVRLAYNSGFDKDNSSEVKSYENS